MHYERFSQQAITFTFLTKVDIYCHLAFIHISSFAPNFRVSVSKFEVFSPNKISNTDFLMLLQHSIKLLLTKNGVNQSKLDNPTINLAAIILQSHTHLHLHASS